MRGQKRPTHSLRRPVTIIAAPSRETISITEENIEETNSILLSIFYVALVFWALGRFDSHIYDRICRLIQLLPKLNVHISNIYNEFPLDPWEILRQKVK